MNEDYGIKEEYDRFYKKLKDEHGQTDQQNQENRAEGIEADGQAFKDGQETGQEDRDLWAENEEQVMEKLSMTAVTILIICIIFCLINALFK